MTTLAELQKALEFSEPWNAERPVLVYIRDEVFEIDMVTDMGAQRCVILVCETKCLQTLRLPPLCKDSGCQTPGRWCMHAPIDPDSKGAQDQTSPQTHGETPPAFPAEQAPSEQKEQSRPTGDLPYGEGLAGQTECVKQAESEETAPEPQEVGA